MTKTTTIPTKAKATPKLAFRPVIQSDLKTCTAIEKASYPPDEAASPEGLRYRCKHAGDYFRCATVKHGDSDIGNDNNGDNEATTTTSPDNIVGFVCATRCQEFTHESMSTHDSSGPLLAIHSVVVKEEYRRLGIATQMLRAYVQHVREQEAAAAVMTATTTTATTKKKRPPVEKLVLLAKSHLLGFYVNCGFSVTRPSPIVHGKELWYELELALPPIPTKSSCFVVDAFGKPGQRGSGNPAGVVLLEQAPSDLNDYRTWMQTVAAEFNLSETAFVWPLGQDGTGNGNRFGIRYFTPTIEVALCGHATLASASILYQTGRVLADQTITLEASNDALHANTVNGDATHICMSFPVKPAVKITESTEQEAIEKMLLAGFGLAKDDIQWVGISPGVGDILVEVSPSHCEWLRALQNSRINYDALDWDGYTRGIILSCRGDGASTSTSTEGLDFCSRFFAPKAGVREDPVTGSAHTVLVPYYSALLGKTQLVAEQWSPRGGWLTCTLNGERVDISGRTVTTLKGNLQ